MASFLIEGNRRLRGEITPQGAKNEALQVICATLLTDQEVRLTNVPDIVDVNNLIRLLQDIGVYVRRNAPGDITFRADNIDLDYLRTDEYLARCSSLRGSILTIGPLVARFGRALISKPGGVHGTEAMYANPQLAEILGDAMGVVFQSNGHKTAYIMGDTVWTADVNKALNRYKPDYLIMNTGYALISGISDGIIMGTADVLKASQVMPKAKIITVHMDTVNHTAVSRADMRKFIRGQGIESRVNVPEDGEIVKLD